MLDVKVLLTKILNLQTGDNGAWTKLNGNGYVVYTKRSGLVSVQGVSSGTVTITAGQWNNLGTLPSGYRPDEAINFLGFDRSHKQPLWGQVTTAGVVRFYADTGQTCNYWEYGVTFPVGGGS